MRLKKELPIIAIVLLPFIYLAYIWNQLPDKVPLHWNLQGEAGRYGDKTELILIPLLLPLLIYVIFLIVPLIDPKKKLDKMGNKLYALKFFLTTFMSLLALYIIYTAKVESLVNPNYIILLLGLLYTILGNYLKTIKPNYFIGIRTPWTLESEHVWKETHKLGGVMFFVGGLAILLSSFLFDQKTNLNLFIVVTIIISLIPIGYSYFKFRKEEKT
jgi:uncharacterized membrane protein